MKTGRSNRYAFFEGKIVPIEEAKVGVMCSALNYGTAVFEGIRAYWNEEDRDLYAFRLEEHFARFLQNARLLLIELPHTAEGLCKVALDLLRREGFQTDVYLRPLAYKASEVVGVRLHDLDARCAMFAVPFGPYIDKPNGARVIVSSWRRVSDNAIPARWACTHRPEPGVGIESAGEHGSEGVEHEEEPVHGRADCGDPGRGRSGREDDR